MGKTISNTRIIAFTNQSGGAGKTTSAVTIAAWLAKYGLKVLFVGLDAQCDGSASLGWDQPDEVPGQATIHNVLTDPGVKLSDAIVPAYAGPSDDPKSKQIEGLDLVLESAELENAEQLLTTMMGRELWLRDALATVADDYDVILLDCPGNLGLVVVNALVAAREVIVCVKPGWKELRALTRIEQTIARVQNTFAANGANPELVGVLMVDTPTSRQSGAVYDDAKTEAEAAYQEKFLPTIRRSTKVPEAYSHQKALPFFDRSAEVTTEYAAVVKALGFRRQN
ncbi:AAA family ATPase (plasmid) [Kitasatospora sp. NBC_01246]|uniref:ParA family protein n=1 Tax=Kitasatospora sp. NBC_01246 TaxID=2903570 RepID=UPI002E355441|nr:AAA family ATPase [Kitasatospora sp. NBC_01246]